MGLDRRNDRHALARPDVGFAIWHEGKLIEQWRRCEAPSQEQQLTQRLADVLGADFIAQSIAVDWQASNTQRTGGDTPPLRIWGRVGIPDAARSRADQQFCYVNGRFVRDKVLTHAARSAYEDVLHGHRQPVYALYLAMDPARVDVNVHPTKIEVRFRDSREVHQGVRHAVEDALAAPRASTAGTTSTANTPASTIWPNHSESNQAPALVKYTQGAMNFAVNPEPTGHRVSDISLLWQRNTSPPQGWAAEGFAACPPPACGRGT